MGKSEKAIMNDTLVELSALPDTMVWRNNTGQAWAGRRAQVRVGDTIVVTPEMTVLLHAQPVSFGLLGSADILGATAGRPLAVEVKDASGRQSEQQKAFQRAWEAAGGVYLLVRDHIEARDSVRVLHPLSIIG